MCVAHSTNRVSGQRPFQSFGPEITLKAPVAGSGGGICPCAVSTMSANSFGKDRDPPIAILGYRGTGAASALSSLLTAKTAS